MRSAWQCESSVADIRVHPVGVMGHPAHGRRHDEALVHAYVRQHSTRIDLGVLDTYVGYWVMRQSPREIADLGDTPLETVRCRITRLRGAARRWADGMGASAESFASGVAVA